MPIEFRQLEQKRKKKRKRKENLTITVRSHQALRYRGRAKRYSEFRAVFNNFLSSAPLSLLYEQITECSKGTVFGSLMKQISVQNTLECPSTLTEMVQ